MLNFLILKLLLCFVLVYAQSRSKRKTIGVKQRKRIRPCLKICQTVEERCPYLLPGDRSPGYNTQYAGEPTFLCNGKCFPIVFFSFCFSFHNFFFCCFKSQQQPTNQTNTQKMKRMVHINQHECGLATFSISKLSVLPALPLN